jgi:general stress protein 26
MDIYPEKRYCTPMADENLTIWMATFVNSRKVAQIRKNPEVHLTNGVTDMETPDS